jgi:hypothetical protein
VSALWSARRDAHQGEDGQEARAAEPDAPITLFQRVMWVLLPACGSVLLLSFTARLSEEVAPIPFLWVLPLAVYLVSFIVSFEWPWAYRRKVFAPLLVLSYWIALAVTLRQSEVWIGWQVAGFMTVLLACCMVCHGEVYRLRPAPSRLTSFYLSIALGGALGGIFVTLIAPRIFTYHFESHIAMFGTFVLLMACMARDPGSALFHGARPQVWLPLFAGVLGAAVFTAVQHMAVYKDAIYRSRNFFGVLSIDERKRAPDPATLELFHGRIVHGVQVMHPDYLRMPTAYFGPDSGAGRVMQNFPQREPRRVGIIGLGVGTLATYGRPGDTFRFYDINPTVIELARHPFAFLASSPATIEVIEGDARLSLEREPPQRYDMLVLDAFSGDAVPVHLLTREAFELYHRHLDDDGAILIHVSNTHIPLHLAVARTADELGWPFRLFRNDADLAPYSYPSVWILLTRNDALLNDPQIDSVSRRPLPAVRKVDLWTDDHANVLQLLLTE